MRCKLGVLGGVAVIALLASAVLAAPAGAKTKTKTFSSGPTAIPIPDQSPPPESLPGFAVSDIGVTKKGTIKDLNAAVQITHTDTADLDLWLFKGDKSIPLAQNVSGPGANDDNFGSGTGCVGGMTVFDSAAPLRIAQGVNPFDGPFRLNQNDLPMSVYNGDQLKGTWRLVVVDQDDVDIGTITCFQVTAKYKAG